jgi:hypothetical protein
MSKRAWCGCLVLLACGLLIGPLAVARAGDDGVEQAIRKARARVAELEARLSRARASGHDDEAADLAEDARGVVRRLEELVRHAKAAHARHRAGARDDARRLMGIERGLAQGIEALQALGGQDDLLEHLRHLQGAVHARRLALARQAERAARAEHGEREEHGERDEEERGEHGERGEDERGEHGERDGDERGEHGERDEDDEAGERAERQGLAQRLEVLRLALQVAREEHRGDAVDLLEHTVHTAELLLSGRDEDDPDVRRAIQHTPPLDALSRVLRSAAELWMQRGHETKARQIGHLAEFYARRAHGEDVDWHPAFGHQAAPRGPDREAAERAHRQSMKAHRQAAERARREAQRNDRLQALQQQVRAMRAQLEQLRRQLEELARER